MHALKELAHLLMELESPGRREVVVQRLADELVRERVAPGGSRQLGDDPDGGCLPEDVEQSGRAEPARLLEEVEIELATDDRRDPEDSDRLVRQARHAAPDQNADLLRDAQKRIAGRLVEALERSSTASWRTISSTKKGLPAVTSYSLAATCRVGLEPVTVST